MKLLFLYGSPAVGKLTVAEEIARMTDFKIFHNHISFDAAAAVFEIGSKPFWDLVEVFRLETFKAAALENVDLIFTYCYVNNEDDEFIKMATDLIEENGSEILFVLLNAEKNVIKTRILGKSRRRFYKVKCVDTLENMWKEYDYFSPVPDNESLIVDNTFMTARETARQIVRHFQLDRNSLTSGDKIS